MSNGSKILLVLAIILVVIGAGFLIGKNIEKKDVENKVVNNGSFSDIIDEYTNTNNKTINDNMLEDSVKKALIEVVNEKHYKDVNNKEGTIGAEGHKILKSEIKNNQIYAYVVAEYGVYKLENNEINPVSASASPITLIFDINETDEYKMVKYVVTSDEGDEAWMASLKEMFPEDLISEATSVNYKDDFYQNQIKKYVDNLKSENASNNLNGTKKILFDVMNNKQKFINEDNKEVFLKDFKIIENQTAKVDKYAFVDMDKDGTEELVIYTTSDYGAYVILHYENDKVYGYMIGVRSLENLKTDGSFMGSSGANSNEYSRMTFSKNSYAIKTEAVYDETNKVYEIDNTSVSEKQIKEFVENWNKKENVSWSK